MKKLNKEQIEEIIKLRNEGKTYLEISKKFNVLPNAIRYHVDSNFRDSLREYNRKRYNQMSQKEKKEYFKNKREYQRTYHQNRYKNDPEFRKKQLERVKERSKKIELKGGKKTK